jgi:(S)-mandelate dehydrogenase
MPPATVPPLRSRSRPDPFRMRHFDNIADLRRAAERRLPRALFDFVDRGAEEETAQPAARIAFDRLRLRPRVLVDVSGSDTSTILFGKTLTVPIIVAPTGIADLLRNGGELAIARAAAQAGLGFTLSTSSATPVEAIAAASDTLWYQLYLLQDRALSLQVIQRAEAAGAQALVVTVDTAVSANREYNRRNGFASPFRLTPQTALDFILHPKWLADVPLRHALRRSPLEFANYPPELRASLTAGPKRQMSPAAITWNDLRWVRSAWPHTLVVKGILDARDAESAIDCGAEAIIVSNHGGRTLDSAVAPIDVLPEIAAQIRGRATILFDGGIRRGSDIAKALALGATAVLVGRAPLYGVAAAGEAGAVRALHVLQDELRRTMALLGVNTVAQLTADLVFVPQR